jgi:rhodanese-related sulfurtransferase
MLRRYVMLTGLLLFSWGCGSLPHRVDSAEAHRLVEQEGGVLVDVRSPKEYAEGHVDGAINVPVGDMAERLGELPRDRPLVLYCRSGGRAARAARLLNKNGFDQVHSLGGMSNW